MTLSDTLSVIGGVTGPLGFVLALLVYFRDRPRVLVNLQFDMQGFGSMPERDEKYFVVQIYNTGRRTIFLSHAHLTIPRWAREKFDAQTLLLGDGLAGVTIAEGGPPNIVATRQTDMETFGPVWAHMRAAVIDAAGRTHYSNWPTEKPDWAGDHRLALRVRINRLLNWGRRWVPFAR